MEKKLRKKFILVSVCSVSLVLFFIAGFIILSNYMQIIEHSENLLEIITSNDGNFPKNNFLNPPKGNFKKPNMMSAETPFSTRYFTVKFNYSGEYIEVNTGKITITTSEAIDYAKSALKKKQKSGFLNYYKYSVKENDYGYLVAFVDCSKDLEMFYVSLKNSILVFIAGVTAVFIMVFFLSKRAVKPVVESYEKQKKFITDASHELKTPLAIISANTDVLEMDSGENEWLTSIKNQTQRLNELVNNLVILTRLDEADSNIIKTDFSISDALIETVNPFIILAENQGKKIESEIEDNITYCGEEKSLRQLFSILIENSIKYSTNNCTINISLKKVAKKIIFNIKNPCDNIQKGNHDIFFERFYRTDTSRNSKTGGYGIGLSIAKAICKKHKAKISANSSDDKSIEFTVIF